MKTILIPTDFSSTAKNAADYAIGIAKQTGAKQVIFYHSYETPVNIGSDVMVPMNFIDPHEIQENADNFLAKLKADYQSTETGFDIEVIAELKPLLEGVNELVTARQVDLIVMGITGGGLVEEKLIGSNALSIAKSAIIPVIIVQDKARFETIDKILMVTDYEDIEENLPVQFIKRFLNSTQAQLLVLTVNEDLFADKEAFKQKMLDGALMLEGFFKEYVPQYDYIDSEDFSTAVSAYGKEVKAQLILIIPKEHGWIESLFKESHTKQLAFRSSIPLLVTHR